MLCMPFKPCVAVQMSTGRINPRVVQVKNNMVCGDRASSIHRISVAGAGPAVDLILYRSVFVESRADSTPR